jgi:hypothetical protein
VFAAAREPRGPLAADEQYPYGEAAFTAFVEESYLDAGAGDASEFYTWMEDAYAQSKSRYPGEEELGLEELLQAKQEALAGIEDPARKSASILVLSSWLHRMVKSVIPRFSLDRGFEFRNVVLYGERQCFLQSVLVAGLLQRMGVDGGVAMVSRNVHGSPTNNGHAVALARLPDGTDLIVDCSEPEPFPRQQGLFVRGEGYEYVAPVYRPGSSLIERYRRLRDGGIMSPFKIRTLDTAFLSSQFYFYRGERVPGGLVAARINPDALERSAEYLRESVRLCPQNPLAVFALGRAYLKQGKPYLARVSLRKACALYAQAGWVPKASRELLALASAPQRAALRR